MPQFRLGERGLKEQKQVKEEKEKNGIRMLPGSDELGIRPSDAKGETGISSCPCRGRLERPRARTSELQDMSRTGRLRIFVVKHGNGNCGVDGTVEGPERGTEGLGRARVDG